MPARRVLFSAQKNERPFILEWVAFHKILGFSDIVVVSNDCTDGSDVLLDQLHAIGEVTHIRQSVPEGESPQLSAARVFLESGYLNFGDWVMWLDLDEYLVVNLGNGRVDDLIAAFPDADAVGVNWRVFGSSGVSEWPGEQISDQFTGASRPKFMANTQMKTLFRYTKKIRRMHLHRPVFKWRVAAELITFIGGDGERMDDSFIHKMMPRKYPVHRIPRERDFHKIGQVNHYAVRTPDLYKLKRARGRGLGSRIDTEARHTDEFFAAHDCNQVTDTAILKYVDEKKAEEARLQRLLASVSSS